MTAPRPAAPPTTLRRTLRAGAVLRRGAHGAYRAIEVGAGEPHLVRDDLAPDVADTPAARRPLLSLFHVTDLQIADVQSPARFEFFNREYGDPRLAALIPVQRPQEALTVHAVDAMVRTLNDLRVSPVTGAPIDLVVTTGDAIDNAQWNEMAMFLALLDGGRVRPGSGGPRYEGVQAVDWPDEVFWKPDGAGPTGPDLFRAWFGFPHLPGLLERALAQFDAVGLALPWLGCYGNHEALIQGVGVPTPALRAYLVGGRKPTGPPADLDRDTVLETFIAGAEALLTGPDREITADSERQVVTRREFVAAHLRARGEPAGHGFSAANLRDDVAYYVHDLPDVRLIALDTTCATGSADGALDLDQARWLTERLAEVHARYRGRDGATVRTGHDDRLVVLFSHHGLSTLTGGPRPSGGAQPYLGAEQVRDLLHRFPNVVLWLNGHTHVNRVTARPDPVEPGRGFWEVSTSALVDWPCQARLVELVDNGDQTLSILCTMIDYAGPVRPAAADHLAARHRELAGNVPFAGFDSPLPGSPADRNVDLRIRAPFPPRISGR